MIRAHNFSELKLKTEITTERRGAVKILRTIKMLRALLIISSLIFVQPVSYGQRIGFSEIDDSKVKPWIPKLTIEYQATYHFGESEMESEMVLIIGPRKNYAQIKSTHFNGKDWIWQYENLKDVKIEGNKFYSNKTNGEFVIYDAGNQNVKGLKIYNSWSGLTKKGEYEIGYKLGLINNYFRGKYPQASMRQLNKDELRRVPKSDLKIMRNEIFARYGYIFKAGGKMDSYFRKQEWYIPEYENVNDFLTDLEKENVKLIQQIEIE